MILEEIDFSEFYAGIKHILSDYFVPDDVKDIMEFVQILSEANFKCYKANMIVIDERKKRVVDYKKIADMEWVARSVGEYRVSSKARINNLISRIKTKSGVLVPQVEDWASDDIVYSIGEMIDRLSIEFIKRKDFSINNRPRHMIKISEDISGKVNRYLRAKLKEIDMKGFYECLHEQRTYDLEGIVEDLVL